MMSDSEDLKAGRKAVPGVKFAYGLVAVAAAAALILDKFASPQLAIAAVVLTLVGMVLVWLFSRLIAAKHKNIETAGLVLIWVSIGVFVACIGFLGSLAIWREPTYLADAIDLPPRMTDASNENHKILLAFFAMLQIDQSTIDPQIFTNDRKAWIFIASHAREFCQKSTNQAMRERVQCDAGQNPISAQPAVVAANLPPPSQLSVPAPVTGTNPCASTALARTSNRPAKILGIDVSNFNAGIDWAKVVDAGYYFVFVKATQGLSYADPRFAENWAAAGKAGLIRGAYHFLGSQDGQKEASFFLTTLGRVQIGPCDLGAALDIELDVSSPVPTSARKVQALSWLEAVKGALGKPPIVYAGRRDLESLGDEPSFAEYPLWIASYSPVPILPKGYSRYSFWQFNNGTQGQPKDFAFKKPDTNVDLNAFNGTVEELFAMTALSSRSSPPPAPEQSFTVYFGSGQSALSPEALLAIEQAAVAMKTRRSARLVVRGHDDTARSESESMALSLTRANAVKDALVRSGVPATVVTVVGRGQNQLLIPTAAGVSEPRNRRAEIIVSE